MTKWRRVAMAALFGLAMICLEFSDGGAAAQQKQEPAQEKSPRERLAAAERERELRERKIRLALNNEKVEIDFFRTPLAEVRRYFSDFHDIPIVIDEKALTEEGVGSDTPVTETLKGISFKSGLLLLLRKLDLTYVVSDEVLLITTPERARLLNIPDVYDVTGLASNEESLKRLAEAVRGALGGEVTVTAASGRLFVSGTTAEQERAERLIEQLLSVDHAAFASIE